MLDYLAAGTPLTGEAAEGLQPTVEALQAARAQLEDLRQAHSLQALHSGIINF